VFGDAPLVSVTVDARALHDPALASADAALDELAGFPSFDEECGAVALRLAATLPARAKPAPTSLLGSARRAPLERSVTARREIERVTAQAAAAGAVTRASTGVYLVVVGRDAEGLAMGAYPVALARAARDLGPVEASSAQGCAALLDMGGTCRASVR
jgi:hypothetical protein